MFHFGKIQGLTTGLRPIYIRVVALLPAYVIFGGYGNRDDFRGKSAEEGIRGPGIAHVVIHKHTIVADISSSTKAFQQRMPRAFSFAWPPLQKKPPPTGHFNVAPV